MTTRRLIALGTPLVVAAALVRLAAAMNEFWLDEIWSLFIALDAKSAWRLFAVQHDNNHILNTLYLRAIGLTDAWLAYRLLAVVAGTATVALSLGCERPERRIEALVAGTLIAFSYPLVLYSAEARGYAPALFCALASFYAVERYWEAPRPAPLIAFWASAIVGLLSHATYLQAYVACAAWSLVRAFRTHRTPDRALRALAALHAVPLAAAVAFFLFFLRGMVVGGGQPYSTAAVVGEAAALAIGVPVRLGAAGLVLLVAATCTGLVVLFARRSPRWPFFVLVLGVVPVSLLVVTRPPMLYFRYFLVQILFGYPLVAAALGALARRGRRGRAACLALLVLYVGAQSPGLYALAATGRGGCVEAVRYLAAHTAGDEIVVGSDEEFRSQLMLWYYARFLPAGKRLHYLARPEWPATGPEWVLLADLGPGIERPPTLQDATGHRFERAARFECGGAARWFWSVYRRAPTPSAAPPVPAPSPAARPSP
jgi:hypothetical protein